MSSGIGGNRAVICVTTTAQLDNFCTENYADVS